MKTIIQFGAVALLVLGAVGARAEFRVEGSEDRKPTTTTVSIVSPAPVARPGVAIAPQADNVFGSVRRSSLTQIGAPTTPPSTLQGFGREVTIVAAVSQVLPAGWRPTSAGAVDPKRIVSWRGGGRTWLAVLDDVSEQAGLMAQVDWAKQEVTFFPSAEYMAASGAGAVKKNTWELRAGKSLQENLDMWARDAGWKLVWRPDFKYVISADATLTGEFEGEDGVVARVTNAYRNAKNPIIPEFFLANRVVEIREMSHNAR